MWRRWSYIRQFKLHLLKLVRLRLGPDEIAKGFALGIFIGMTPTFGFQMLIAVFFALLLQENKIAAALGVWITNPITAPLIYALEYESGRLLLGLDRVGLPAELTFSSIKTLGYEVMTPLLVGSLIYGLVLGMLAYGVSLRMVPYLRLLKIPRWPKRSTRL